VLAFGGLLFIFMNFPTIFDWVERLAFLRGDVALLLVMATAVFVLLVPDLRLAVLGLAAQYFAAALLFVEVLDPRLAIVKLLTGWFVCLILAITGSQVGWDRLPDDVTADEAARLKRKQSLRIGQYTVPQTAVRGLLVLLALALVWWGGRQMALPVIDEGQAYLGTAVLALAGFGILGMTFVDQPLRAGMGALMFLSGFELFYSLLDQSIAALALLAAANMAVALAAAYVAQTRVENGEWRMESGEWRMENGEWRVENGEWRMKIKD
jgi:hypothetical protein